MNKDMQLFYKLMLISKCKIDIVETINITNNDSGTIIRMKITNKRGKSHNAWFQAKVSGFHRVSQNAARILLKDGN